MVDVRHAGMHWPTGGENPSRAAIYELPGVHSGGLIMLSESARFWYSEARTMCPLVIWRGLPRQGKLPAQLGWSPSKVADEVLNLWDEQPHSGTEYFVPLNELQFGFESGHGTFPGFSYIAEKLGQLRVELRKRLPYNVKLVFPAWGPDQPYMDAPFDSLGEWVDEAKRWDVISAHVYSHDHLGDPDFMGAANVWRTHKMYRNMFPDHPIVYTEWNGPGHEREMLKAMAEICNQDRRCLGFMYYIWQTQRSGESQLSVWGNQERLDLFRNPPTTMEFPMYALPSHVPTTEEIFKQAKITAFSFGIPLETFIALLIAESGYNFDKLARWRNWTSIAETAIENRDWMALQNVVNNIASFNSDDISFGPAHQAYRWSKEYDPSNNHAFRYDLTKIMAFRALYIENPEHALTRAATLLSSYLAMYFDPLEALCRYNSPNTQGINNPNRDNYERALELAPRRIAELTTPEPEEPMPEYHFGFEDLADRLGREVVGEPLSDETYISPDVSIQFTENGIMMYSKQANKSHFFGAAR